MVASSTLFISNMEEGTYRGGWRGVKEEEDRVTYEVWSRRSNEEWKTKEDLECCRVQYLEYVSKYTKGYIWHKDSFYLEVIMGKEQEQQHLGGSVRFADNVDDEWFIVFLLFELSKAYPDLIVRVTDTDGQFLLIEAALVIPKWLNPENSRNRVFVSKGKVHIIPLARSPAELVTNPYSAADIPLAEALKVMRSSLAETPQEVQKCILSRLCQFPQKAIESRHRTRCYIPIEIVFLLQKNPQLVALAVEAFYYRDLKSVKYCRTLEKFGKSRKVMCMVNFTRTLYAMLVKQNFEPPIVYGSLPQPSHPDFKAYDLGAKLTCGFEMLYQDALQQVFPTSIISLQFQGGNIEKDQDWKVYNAYLERNGFYQKTAVNSEERLNMEKLAKQQYLQSVQRRQESNPNIRDSAKVIDGLLKMCSDTVDPGSLVPDDNDSWINISRKDVDDLLQGNDPDSQMQGLSNLINDMKSFVEGESSFEGVELPGEHDVEFEEQNFLSLLRNTLGLAADGTNVICVVLTSTDLKAESESDYSDEEISEHNEEGEESMASIMAKMDLELLSNASIGHDFEKSHDDQIAVDIDYNLAKNMLESYAEQHGLAGPISNILGALKSSK